MTTAERFHTFRETRYFPALQQVRTLSVAWVVASHMGDPIGKALYGALGVITFFAVSGFLITTLLLREEDERGRVSLRNFFIRRAFRILPLYLMTFAAFAILILGLRLGGEVDKFVANLPYYLAYQNDFAPAGPFGHTWSLAIEEKFYLVWPLIGFGAVGLFRRNRTLVLASLSAVAVAAQPFGFSYLTVYAPVLVGCLLAVLMNSPRGFKMIAHVARPSVSILAIVGAGAAGWIWSFADYRVNVPFAVLFTIALAGLVTADGWYRRVVEVPLLVWAGARTYAVYLIHPLAKSMLDVAIPDGQESVVVQALRFVLVVLISFGAAELLLRWFEEPLIKVGRRFTRRAIRPASSSGFVMSRTS